ncbi:MAG: STAS domain-containing protein [Maricaulaceae bacterium]|nr:STAS domain-containing protein [Maricaulaceae bacterium]
MKTPARKPATPRTPDLIGGWRLYTPKLYTVLRRGYGWADLRADALAGLTVAIVALPLAMALAIASGATPDKGLVTAVVAGFLISALGGSRYQIGGPTGAFVVVVFNVIAVHGYDGLVIATLMAGMVLILAGLLRLGSWVKYIPDPVVTGFTAGIAVIILISQVKDFFGLDIAVLPADFMDKLRVLLAAADTLDFTTTAIAGGALALILVLRRFAPRAPGFLIAIGLAALAVALLNLPVETIGSRFGELPRGLPAPSLPDISFSRLAALVPSALTIAFLAGVESLLSAMVADGMTGARHRSNCELTAQGVANIGSALFGGLPATGAIARTATSIRAGAKGPVAGMMHAVFLLAFMLFLAPLAAFAPLAALAAVLVVVAWNMSEIARFRRLLNTGPAGDRLVLVLTFFLTVLVDLTVAIQVGVVLAAVLFMHRMSEVVGISTGAGPVIEGDAPDRARNGGRRPALPPGVESFTVRGPLFFGVAGRMTAVIDAISGAPDVFILDLSAVPLIDSTGAGRLEELLRRLKRENCRVILAGLQPQPRRIVAGMGLMRGRPRIRTAPDFAAAAELARTLAKKD